MLGDLRDEKLEEVDSDEAAEPDRHCARVPPREAAEFAAARRAGWGAHRPPFCAVPRDHAPPPRISGLPASPASDRGYSVWSASGEPVPGEDGWLESEPAAQAGDHPGRGVQRAEPVRLGPGEKVLFHRLRAHLVRTVHALRGRSLPRTTSEGGRTARRRSCPRRRPWRQPRSAGPPRPPTDPARDCGRIPPRPRLRAAGCMPTNQASL